MITLDDELDLWLEKQPNQNQVVRDALRLYKGNIDSHTLQGFRRAFSVLDERTKELEERFLELYDMVEKIYNAMEELRAR